MVSDLVSLHWRAAAFAGRHPGTDPGPDVLPASNNGRWPSGGSSPHLSVLHVEPGRDADRRPGRVRIDRGTSHQARRPGTRPLPSSFAGATITAPTSRRGAPATSCPATSRPTGNSFWAAADRDITGSVAGHDPRR